MNNYEQNQYRKELVRDPARLTELATLVGQCAPDGPDARQLFTLAVLNERKEALQLMLDAGYPLPDTYNLLDFLARRGSLISLEMIIDAGAGTPSQRAGIADFLLDQAAYSLFAKVVPDMSAEARKFAFNRAVKLCRWPAMLPLLRAGSQLRRSMPQSGVAYLVGEAYWLIHRWPDRDRPDLAQLPWPTPHRVVDASLAAALPGRLAGYVMAGL